MKKIVSIVFFLLIVILPIKISAMVLRVVEAPTIVEVKQSASSEKLIEFKLAYPETLKGVLDHYQNVEYPLELLAEININKSGWTKCEISNPKVLDEVKNFVWTSPLNFNDVFIQFRVQIIDKVGYYISSEWADEYIINQDKLLPDIQEELQPYENDESDNEVLAKESSCLLEFMLCCKTFIGMSLCIWILITVVLLIMIVFGAFSLKNKKVKKVFKEDL